MQYDIKGVERVVWYQLRQLQPAERNYLVHDMERLATKYSLANYRMFLIIYILVFGTDNTTLRKAVNIPQLS